MFTSLRRRPSSDRPTTRRKRSPVVESLEGRQLLSLGSEFHVNTTTHGVQTDSANAMSSNGSSVVVWTDYSGGVSVIRGQRYNSSGGKTGSEMILASKPGLSEYSPSVAMDSHGNFVVSYTEQESGGDTNILAQKFNSSGAAVSPVVGVGVGTFREHDSSVAMDANGNYAVAYVRDTNNNNPDVFVKQYNSNSALTNVITVAGSAKAETRPSIAMTPDGRFDVAYEYQFSNTDTDVYASRYAANGALLGSSAVAISTSVENMPSVAIDDSGNAVIAYEKFVGSDYDIKARRLSNNGTLSSEINIVNTTDNETAPSVAIKHSGGPFVVAYSDSHGVEVASVNSSNSVTSIWNAGSQRFGAAISANSSGQFLVTYTTAGTDPEIFGRRGNL